MCESRVLCEICKSCGNRSVVSTGRHFHSRVRRDRAGVGGCCTLTGLPIVVPRASCAVVFHKRLSHGSSGRSLATFRHHWTWRTSASRGAWWRGGGRGAGGGGSRKR